jgi:hypothetical protein
MDETKKCQMCKSDIAQDAKRCPHCTSIQHWLYSPFVKAGALVMLYLALILPLGIVFHDALDRGEPFEDYPRALEISESRLTFGETDSGPTVVVLGVIENNSDVDWEEIYLQVNCYNQQNQLVDTEQDWHYFHIAPTNTTVPFKVSFIRQFPESEYVRHEVTVLHAKDKDGW